MKYIKSVAEIKAEQEAKVERTVEHNMNWLDHKLMNNHMSQEQYDKEVQGLNSWAEWAIKLGE
jgi:hypothetical protein